METKTVTERCGCIPLNRMIAPDEFMNLIEIKKKELTCKGYTDILIGAYEELISDDFRWGIYFYGTRPETTNEYQFRRFQLNQYKIFLDLQKKFQTDEGKKIIEEYENSIGPIEHQRIG